MVLTPANPTSLTALIWGVAAADIGIIVLRGTVSRTVGAADGVWLSGTVARTAGAADGVWYSAALRFGVVGFGSLLLDFYGGITVHGRPREPQMVLLKSRSINGSPGNSLDGVAVATGSPQPSKTR